MLFHELRQAARRAWRDRFTFAVVSALIACGVSGSAALFSVIDGVLFKPLPYPQSNKLLAIGSRQAGSVRPGPISLEQIESIAANRALFIAYYIPRTNAEADDTGNLRGTVAAVSPNFFEVLRVRPHLGRLLDDRDKFSASPRPTVLSYARWRNDFGANSGIVGQVVDWSGDRVQIVGVAAAECAFPDGASAWIPIPPPSPDAPRDFAFLQAFVRVPDDEATDTVTSRLDKYSMQPLHDYVRPEGTSGLSLLLVATVLVLMVAWVQVAAVQLVRTDQTRKELLTRLALGATPRHLLIHRVAEGLCLAASATLLAVLIVPVATHVIVAQLPWRITKGLPIHTDWRVLTFALVTSLAGIAAVLAVPVLSTRAPSALGALRAKAAPGEGRAGRQILMLVQISIAAALLYVAGLTFRSYTSLQSVDLGFVANGLIAIRVPRASANPDPIRAFQRSAELMDLVSRLPGVAAVSASDSLPYGGQTRGTLALDKGGRKLSILQSVVDSTYFSTLGIHVTRGRTFAVTDVRGAPLVGIANERAAAILASANAGLDSSVYLNGLRIRIVGIVGDTRDIHPASSPEPRVYLSLAQWIPPVYLIARVSAPSQTAVAAMIAARVHGTAAEASGATSAISLSERLEDRLTDFRGRSTLLALGGLIALALTFLGVWANVAASTNRRASEIAVRLVCGANPIRMSAAVISEALGYVLTGLIAGLLVGVFVSRFLSALFFGVNTIDARTCLQVGATLVALALLASALPAVQAARIDPCRLLREE
jgi:putative ABC transport system permease protein